MLRHRVLAGAASLAVVVAAAGCGGDTTTSVGTLPLALVRDVPLPGPASRYDYQDLDPTARRLYIAHLAASEVTVVDLDTLEPVTTISGVGGVHGVRVAADRSRVFASATPYDLLVAIDTTSDQILWKTPTGRFPDGVGYDPTSGRVFVSNKDDGSETVVDAATGTVVATVPLAGEVGNVIADPDPGRMLVATHSPDRLVTLDAAAATVVAHSELPGCRGAHGIAIDATDRLAFVACEDDDRVVSVDLATGQPSTPLPTGGTPDVLAYDPGLHRLYVAAEDGVVAVFDLRGRALTAIGRVELAAHAHTVAVDPATHRVFFPLEDVDGRPVLRVMQPTA